MNFGMFTDFHVRKGASQAQAFDESFAQISEAEQMGFDTVWLAEHHFSPERAVLASPMVIASAIAARTQRIRTGLAVQVLPLTNPLRVAEEAATVDHISKGDSISALAAAVSPATTKATTCPTPRAAPASSRRWKS